MIVCSRWTFTFFLAMSVYARTLTLRLPSYGNHTFSSDEDFDASVVTWAHAVNSRELLREALQNNDIDFLEADVLMGNVTGESSAGRTVIMAHPPAEESDITLEQWLDEVHRSGPDKGVKLDFKSSEALRQSLTILQKSKLPETLWLNADILPGPMDYNAPAVDAKDLLQLCSSFPKSTLSPGWTTSVPFAAPESKSARYSWQDVWVMARTIACTQCDVVTFPVRAIFVNGSVPQLTWLTSTLGNKTTLTVWHSLLDVLDVQDLLQIRRSFPESKVYYDLLENVSQEFEKVKSTASYQPDPIFDPNLWAVLRRSSEPFGCDDSTTVSPGVQVLYGGRRDVAVVYNKLLTYPLEVSGRLSPYELADYDGNYTCRQGDVQLVLATNQEFWEGDWARGDRTEVAFGVADPCRSASSSSLQWSLRLDNASSPAELVTTGDNSSVDVTQFHLDLNSNSSSFVVGFVFRGERAMVMEDVRIRGTPVEPIPVSGANGPDSPSAVLTVLASVIAMILHVFFLSFAL